MMQYLPTFLIGAIAAARLDSLRALGARITQTRAHRAWWALIVIAAVLLTTAKWTLGPDLPDALGGTARFLVVLGAFFWFFLALECPPVTRFLTLPAVHWLGGVSFSLYLVHEPIAVAVGQLLPGPLLPLALLLTVPLSLLAAWGFSIIVEKPSHRLAQSVRRRTAAFEAGGARCVLLRSSSR